REVPGTEPGAFLDAGARVQQHGDDRGVAGPRRRAARRTAPSSPGVSAPGSPGPGMRARLTDMRMPACSYISVTAASAWLTVDGLDLAVIMCRFHAVTAPSAPTRSANA